MLPYWLDLSTLQMIPFFMAGAALFFLPTQGYGGKL